MTTLPLERTLFRRSFDDGCLDLLVGIGLVGIGIVWMNGLIALTAVIPAVLIPFWAISRKTIVQPRLSQPRFRDARLQATRRNLTGWLILGSAVFLAEITILLVAARSDGGTLSGAAEFAVGIPAALVAVGLLAGLLTGARRFAGYSLAAFALAAAGALLAVEEPGLLIALCGALPLLTGSAMLTLFLRRYPLTERGDDE